ncbi:MAG: hypothetical protein A2X61_13625 [Ignavibacteria bacterium GWB2_35_12]|nr:MAG: hypothetical protein A2X61_13625 [Ignavibacteria bacterium GWB2_35_12]OGU95201.1 MAG: hypothetical protein A2220_00285 [Ignavibacteria bacterium RIFOXYA2_FULL_35_10]OGV24507.1 MAG: hypothetical protein A2475_15490 [Ignavibacteria bacterium RIFOXYC2_FULL_35_21]
MINNMVIEMYDLEKVFDTIKRNVVWILLIIFAVMLINLETTEIRTFILIVITECIAMALSGVAQFVYTRIDFTKESANNNLGYIFLGVHICVGLIILGVYIVQFSN